MARGGYQKRRIQEKKERAKRARKRAERRKKLATWLVSLTALGLIGLIVVLVITGGNDVTKPAASPSPTPSASLPPGCTETTRRAEPAKTYDAPPKMTIDKAKSYEATFETNCGDITIELLDDDAPKTVNNFVFLAKDGFYDGTIFHRVIPNFGGPGSNMVQGGDGVNFNGTGDPGYEFGDENMIPFDEPGYLAMANSGPGSNGSQFFFLDGTVSHLNAPDADCPGQGCHSVFGKVIEGLDVIALIASVPMDPEDPSGSTPLFDIVVERVTIAAS